MKFVFSPDVILCGCLGSNHLLTFVLFYFVLAPCSHYSHVYFHLLYNNWLPWCLLLPLLLLLLCCCCCPVYPSVPTQVFFKREVTCDSDDCFWYEDFLFTASIRSILPGFQISGITQSFHFSERFRTKCTCFGVWGWCVTAQCWLVPWHEVGLYLVAVAICVLLLRQHVVWFNVSVFLGAMLICIMTLSGSLMLELKAPTN